MVLRKCINIHGEQGVLGGVPGGATGGVRESACYDGGVFRFRAVPGAAISHFKKK